jgi:predicted transposase YbfD/YdcC
MGSLEMASKKQESVDELVSKSLWAAGTLVDHLGAVEDPRGRQGRLHVFTDILAILVLGTVCGCDDAEELEDWASKEKDWLSTFLQLPHGIPSQDTYLRALSSMNPDQFRMVFHGWVKELFQALGIPGQVAVDGKTIRGSRRKTTDKSVVHMVSALCCESGLVCGQIRTGEKTNEIGVFPELLSLLRPEGNACEHGCDGVPLRRSSPLTPENWMYFKDRRQGTPAKGCPVGCDNVAGWIHAIPQLETNEHVDGGHGRVETRRVSVCHDFRDWVPSGERFIGLNTLIQVESRVEKKNGNQILEETRYYVSSRKMTAVAAQEAVRNHWHVENRLHWVLDMTFSEDHCRTRTEHAAENLSVIRHFAINVLRNYQGDRHSLRRRRRLCNYKRDYRYLVLSAAAMS